MGQALGRDPLPSLARLAADQMPRPSDASDGGRSSHASIPRGTEERNNSAVAAGVFALAHSFHCAVGQLSGQRAWIIVVAREQSKDRVVEDRT